MPDNKKCWPSNGEIDIMEMIDGDGTTHGTYHWQTNGSCGDKNDSIRTQDATKVESKNDWSRILRSVYKQRSASYVKEMKVFDQKMVGKLSTIVPPQPFSDVRVRKRRKEDNTSATDMFAEMFPCDTSADI